MNPSSYKVLKRNVASLRCGEVKEKVSAADEGGDAEEECFWHERGRRVIMMSLGAYSKTVWRRLVCCSTPQGHHYQLEVSRDLSTGQTQAVVSRTHTQTQKNLSRHNHLPRNTN